MKKSRSNSLKRLLEDELPLRILKPSRKLQADDAVDSGPEDGGDKVRILRSEDVCVHACCHRTDEDPKRLTALLPYCC